MFRWLRRRAAAPPVDAEAPRDTEWERIGAAIDAAALDRQRRLAGQEHVVAHVEALLFGHDPIGINFEINSDEYRPEAETIVLRRDEARSVDDVRRIAHEEFVRWFDPDTAGPEARYQAIAESIWQLWTTPSPDAH